MFANIIRSVAHYVIPIGTEYIISGIAANAVKNQSKICKLAAGISSLVIGGMIGEKATDYFDEKTEELKQKMKKFESTEAEE